MALPFEHVGNILGKAIHVTPRSGRQSSIDELKKFLRKFPTNHTLRALGIISAAMETNGDLLPIIHGVPIPRHLPAYLGLLSIEVSNDYRGAPMADKDLATAIQMANDLPDPILDESLTKEDAALEFLLRLGLSQFYYQGELRHVIPRALLLLKELWPADAKVNPGRDVQELSGGLSLETIVCAGLVFMATAKSGVVAPVEMPAAHPLAKIITGEAQEKFLSWISASYGQIREKSRIKLPSKNYDQYRPNPLIMYPIVRSDQQGGSPPRARLLTPCPRLVLLRATKGLYYNLLDKHNLGPRKNAFKEEFGMVFQNYVGLLLRAALGESRVLNEWRYDKDKDTPDWIVLEGNRAVLVEVKQSALFLETKAWGHLEGVGDDTKKTIGRGTIQIATFEKAMATKAKGLEKLANVEFVERLIVTFDSLHFGNWIVSEQIKQQLAQGQVPSDFYVHYCSVEDLEYALARCWGGSLYDMLKRKRSTSGNDAAMDFKEWAYADNGNAVGDNPLLSSKYEQIMDAWGVKEGGTSFLGWG
jgi:hypothetical protein